MIFLKKLLKNSQRNLQNLIHSEEKKYQRLVIYLTITGFFLRLIAALNLDVFADDMVYASQSAGILSAKLISTHSNPPLFFYLTDLAYKVFGYSTFASRFWPLVAGTLLIPLTYLICNKLLNDKKTSFFASLFVTFSSFLIRMTFTEQSLVVLFFIFSGIFCGMLFAENKKISYLILVSCFFGLALLTKYSAPFFIVSFIIYLLVDSYLKKSFEIFSMKNILLFTLILILFSLPFLSFNYILYNQKGIVDVYFSRIIHLNSTQQLYGGLAGQENSFFDNLFNISNYGNYNLPFMTDKLLFIFSIYGLWLFFKKSHYRPLAFVSIILLIPFILQSAGAPLAKHFTFMHILLAIPAGYGLSSITKKINHKKFIKITIYSLIFMGFIFYLGNAYQTPNNYITKGPNSQLKSFINEEVSSDSLLVFDTRIYTARSMWLATDKAYITFDQAPEFLEQIFSQNFQVNPINVYFIECIVDDCGWGWVASNQDLNISSEAFISSILPNVDVVKTISTNQIKGNEFKNGRGSQQYYKVYHTKIKIPVEYLPQIKKSQSFYFAPYLYTNLENYIFNYKTIDPFSRLLDKTSNFLLLFSLVISLLSFIFILILYLIES